MTETYDHKQNITVLDYYTTEKGYPDASTLLSKGKKLNDMQRTILLAVACLASSYLKGQSQLTVPHSDSIQAMLVKMDVPGVAIATIENGVVNRIMSVGTKGPAENISVNEIFNTASLTKSVTAFLTLELVKKGMLDLDEKLYKYWTDPDLKGDKRVKQLTPHIILSHRTGFDNWRWMNDEKKLRFNFDPDTQVGYSGEGFEYLRKSLEAKFNKTFTELVDAYVFEPLNMQDSYLSWSDEVDESRYAGEFKTPEEPYEITKTDPSAADDLLTTANDLAGFCRHVLNLLNENMDDYEKYFEPHSDVREGIKFTYGWIRFDDLPNEEYALFSAGGDAGVSAIMCILPKSNRGIVVLSNGENRGLVVNLLRLSLGDTGNQIVGRFQ